MDAEQETELEYALRGKAWKVYWYLLKTGTPQSVREVQRALHFSSPSVANHHLEQLRQLGLVEKQELGGHYFLVNEVKIGVLRHYVKLGKLLFPRYFFYAVFSTTFYMAFLLFLMLGLKLVYSRKLIHNLVRRSRLLQFSGMRHTECGICVRTNSWNSLFLGLA